LQIRLYPGLSRDFEKFKKIYNRRTAIERSLNPYKDTLGLADRKTSNILIT